MSDISAVIGSLICFAVALIYVKGCAGLIRGRADLPKGAADLKGTAHHG